MPVILVAPSLLYLCPFPKFSQVGLLWKAPGMGNPNPLAVKPDTLPARLEVGIVSDLFEQPRDETGRSSRKETGCYSVVELTGSGHMDARHG